MLERRRLLCAQWGCGGCVDFLRCAPKGRLIPIVRRPILWGMSKPTPHGDRSRGRPSPHAEIAEVISSQHRCPSNERGPAPRRWGESGTRSSQCCTRRCGENSTARAFLRSRWGLSNPSLPRVALLTRPRRKLLKGGNQTPQLAFALLWAGVWGKVAEQPQWQIDPDSGGCSARLSRSSGGPRSRWRLGNLYGLCECHGPCGASLPVRRDFALCRQFDVPAHRGGTITRTFDPLHDLRYRTSRFDGIRQGSTVPCQTGSARRNSCRRDRFADIGQVIVSGAGRQSDHLVRLCGFLGSGLSDQDMASSSPKL